MIYTTNTQQKWGAPYKLTRVQPLLKSHPLQKLTPYCNICVTFNIFIKKVLQYSDKVVYLQNQTQRI